MHKKIAIISDIHSNSFALEAVLKDISARDIQLIVNLGDCLFGPVDPLGTAKSLMDNNKVINIMGNCDEILLHEHSNSETFKFVKPKLGREIVEWIRSFNKTWVYEDLMFCHGTPYANDQYLLEDVQEYGVKYKSAEQLSMELEEVSQKYLFCGHSHVFGLIYASNGKFVVNAGSVGLPAYKDSLPFPHIMESKSPHANYVVAHRTLENNWNIEHVMVHYDWDKASSIAEANGREDYAFAIKSGWAIVE
ncbi:metallophosphatase family protein [Paenibacillus sp. N1-5-1-14]|uniref:metallophosphoesterase family protein n=1 Tax=Paenibacillus radicibacter TaxID=2972488 RepID=UPI0021598E44|nr:metallophosphoesterase family protein [Paenibacillus radicibacter]MCR8645487.1 metallophosphatase family protein [Paenibacillus radicibacter]